MNSNETDTIGSPTLTSEELDYVIDVYKNRPGHSPFMSAVKIYENDVLMVGDDGVPIHCNMTTGPGREFTNQRIFGHTGAFNASVITDLSDHVVTHFGVGSGGATVTNNGSSFSLNGPTVCDDDLYDPQPIHITALPSPSAVANVLKLITSTSSPTSPTPGTFTAEVSPHNEFTPCANSMLTVMKVSLVIEADSEPMIGINDSMMFNELGLYATKPGAGNTYTDPILYAHLCLGPKWIQLSEKYTLHWYIIS